MSRWFRHYGGMCRDPKFLGVAASSGQPLERVVYVASWLMEDASDRDESGACSGEAAQIAYMLRCDPADISAIIEGLNTVGFIKDGVIVAWAKRQFESDSSTERSRRHRERKRQESVPATSRNADATLQGRDATPPDTDTDTERTIPNGMDAASASPPPAPAFVDAVDELWKDGRLTLVQLGLTHTKAGEMIGKWLRDTGGNAAAVLDAIQRAREERTGTPIPFVTSRLPVKRKAASNSNGKRTDRSSDFLAAFTEGFTGRTEPGWSGEVAGGPCLDLAAAVGGRGRPQ